MREIFIFPIQSESQSQLKETSRQPEILQLPQLLLLHLLRVLIMIMMKMLLWEKVHFLIKTLGVLETKTRHMDSM